MRTKLTPVSGFSHEAIEQWAAAHLAGACTVVASDGLACFRSVKAVGCRHEPIIVGGRKPSEVPELQWVNTVLGNLKTSLSGAYHGFAFRKYAAQYLGAFAYRFNRRFDLSTLHERLVVAAVDCTPQPQRRIRVAEAHC